MYRVQQKSSPLKFFAVFSATIWNFWFEISQLYLLKQSTSDCQVKFDSVEKWQSYKLFNMTAYKNQDKNGI